MVAYCVSSWWNRISNERKQHQLRKNNWVSPCLSYNWRCEVVLGTADAWKYMEPKLFFFMDRWATPLFSSVLLLVSQTYPCDYCFHWRSCPYPLWYDEKSSYFYSNYTSYAVRQTLNHDPMHLKHDVVTLLTQHKHVHAFFHVSYRDITTKFFTVTDRTWEPFRCHHG